MSVAPELDSLHKITVSLRNCVASLRARYGDIAPMRRIVNDADRLLNDIDRLDIDADELDFGRAATKPYTGEKIPVPDTPYDTEFWADVDDEGIGGQLRSR